MTVARAGVLPGTTQRSQTLFISLNAAMSVSQMVAESTRLLCDFASASNPSMIDRISWVCAATPLPGAFAATWPARYTVLLWITTCDMPGPVCSRSMDMAGLSISVHEREHSD